MCQKIIMMRGAGTNPLSFPQCEQLYSKYLIEKSIFFKLFLMNKIVMYTGGVVEYLHILMQLVA